MFFSTADPAVAWTAGFAHCPGRVPPDDLLGENFDFEPWTGDWYTFIVRYELYSNRFRGAQPFGLQLRELHARPHV
ncbi:hypothetical protein KZZ52_37505 [Dactylosporangium sp. AC04546]|uniref:hypothetical protein n=1 Tax=Dactylosporangium sp. AC04546 TaxID=2862460 RepID=UPI001EE01EDA|nr:hypothetical protein [Dactylosporangium sp. AC04546]WVK79662.1 hypothetical protein KZZ52_37505 [Dactylosporangium sp. AC04546]